MSAESLQLSPRATSFAETAAAVADTPSFVDATVEILQVAQDEALNPDQIRLAFGDADRRHRKALKVSQLVLDVAYPLAVEAVAAKRAALEEVATFSCRDITHGRTPLRLVPKLEDDEQVA